MAIYVVHGMCLNILTMINQNGFQEQAKEIYVKRSPNGTCRPAPTMISEKMTDDAASENLLKLNIYFGSKSVTTVTEIATYSGVSI